MKSKRAPAKVHEILQKGKAAAQSQPKMRRVPMREEVSNMIRKIIDEGNAELRAAEVEIQKRCNAANHALCSLEAQRLGLKNWRLSDDLTALEVAEAEGGPAAQQ